jgi:hypothetical protein
VSGEIPCTVFQAGLALLPSRAARSFSALQLVVLNPALYFLRKSFRIAAEQQRLEGRSFR